MSLANIGAIVSVLSNMYMYAVLKDIFRYNIVLGTYDVYINPLTRYHAEVP